jgi:outer membrane immunogenic protein
MRHTLKTITLAAGVSLVALGTGFAADLGNRPVYKAPPAPAPMFSWTGFYIGGHVGYGWGRNEFTDTSNALFGGAGATYNNDTDGFLGGLQAGFDYQFAPNWLLGIEGQVSWANIDGSTAYASPIPATFSNDVNWISSVTGRLGFTPGSNWLLYGKGGVAWADIDHTVSTGFATVTNGQTRTGWTAGAGVEYAFAPGWSAKVEYQYYDFGKDTYNFAPVGGGAAFGPFDVDTNIHTVKAGLNWRFGGLGGRW